MNVKAQQCSFCQRVRYETVKDQWSAWMKKLPQTVMYDACDIAICDNPACKQARAEVIAKNR